MTFILFYLTAETMGRRNSCTIYVGNLPGDIREREVEDLFYKVNIQFCVMILALAFLVALAIM